MINDAVSKVAGELATHGGNMPGYGQTFVKGSEVWYVGGDGDEPEFYHHAKKKLSTIKGVTKVTYESEGFPPKNSGWTMVYPTPTDNAKVKVSAAGDVEVDTDGLPPPVPPPPPASPEEPPPPFGKVDPGLARRIEDLQMKVYKAVDDGEDPGPLTERLSKMKRAAGLVEDVDPLDDDTAVPADATTEED